MFFQPIFIFNFLSFFIHSHTYSRGAPVGTAKVVESRHGREPDHTSMTGQLYSLRYRLTPHGGRPSTGPTRSIASEFQAPTLRKTCLELNDWFSFHYGTGRRVPCASQRCNGGVKNHALGRPKGRSSAPAGTASWALT